MKNVKNNTNFLALTLKILISVALVTLALGHVDWNVLSVTNVNLLSENLFIALLEIIFSYVLASSRWYLLLKEVGCEIRFFECLSLYFASGLINQGIPSTLGGDSYRAFEAGKFIKFNNDINNNSVKKTSKNNRILTIISGNFRLSIAVVVLDRIIGLIGNNLVGSFGMIFSGFKIAIWVQQLGYIVLFITILAILFLFLIFYLKLYKIILYKFFNKYLLKRIFFVLYSFKSLKKVFVFLLISILIHLLNVLAFGNCLKALGEEMSLFGIMIGLPLITLFTLIPVSVSGWGVREITLSAILSYWSNNPSFVVLASIFYGLLTIMAMVPGVYFFLRNRFVNNNSSVSK
jgi:uncharacterized membrane protein YbhN (UPF0104 family)